MKRKFAKPERQGLPPYLVGEPLAEAEDYLFNSSKVAEMSKIEPWGDMFPKQRVIGIDFAAKGSDLSVATVLDRVGQTHWRVVAQEAWSEADPMVSTGKNCQPFGAVSADGVNN